MNEKNDDSQKPDSEAIKLEKLKLKYSFAKFFLGTFILGLAAVLVNWTIESHKLKQEYINQNNKHLSRFTDHIIDKDLERRRDLALFYSSLSLPGDVRDGWNNYYIETKKLIANGILTEIGIDNTKLERMELNQEYNTEQNSPNVDPDKLKQLEVKLAQKDLILAKLQKELDSIKSSVSADKDYKIERDQTSAFELGFDIKISEIKSKASPYSIENNLLKGPNVTTSLSPNVSSGNLNQKYLVFHFTAGRSLESYVNFVTNPDFRTSDHIIIGRDGKVVQLVPFNVIAWHAGRSKWAGDIGLNRYSIGITFDNPGKLEKRSNNWYSWWGRIYPDEEVIVATHKHESEPSGWYVYTPQQIETAFQISRVLIKKYNVVEVLGHDDITAPGRKPDPGPAFPMNVIRRYLYNK